MTFSQNKGNKMSKEKVREKVEKVKGLNQSRTFFIKETDSSLSKMKVRARPVLVRASHFEPGMVLAGVLDSLQYMEAPKGGEKPWCLMLIKPDGNEVGVRMAAGAIIRESLEIVLGKDNKWVSPNLGKRIGLKLGEPPKLNSQKGNDAWNFVVQIQD
jgi:hypothetical protein